LLISGPIINHFGWRYVFYIFGGLGAIWLFLWVIFAASGPNESFFISYEEKLQIHCSQSISPISKDEVPWRIILSSAPVWAMAVCFFCNGWAFYTLLMWLPTYMSEELHFDISSSGVYTFLPYVSPVIVQNAGGRFADYIVAKKRFDLTLVRKSFTTTACLLAAISISLLCFNPRPLLCVTLLILSQGFQGLIIGGLLVNHIDLSPKYASVIFGIANTAASLPGTIATLLIGIVLNKTHDNWAVVFGMSACVQVFGVIVYLIFGSAKPILP